MDISSLSTTLSMVNTSSDVGVAMLAKAMDTQESMGASMVAMIDAAAMEQSVTPHIGGNFDMSV